MSHPLTSTNYHCHHTCQIIEVSKKKKNTHYFVPPRKETSVLHAHSRYVPAVTLLPTVNFQKLLNSRFPLQTRALHANSAPKQFVHSCNQNQVFTCFTKKTLFSYSTWTKLLWKSSKFSDSKLFENLETPWNDPILRKFPKIPYPLPWIHKKQGWRFQLH